MKTPVMVTILGVALIAAIVGTGFGWHQHAQLAELRQEVDTQRIGYASLSEELEQARRDGDQAHRRADVMGGVIQASARAAKEALDAAEEAAEQAAQAEQAATEAAAERAEAARQEAERQVAVASEAHQDADVAAEESQALEDECPPGPGEEAAACWAQQQGLTLTCPGTDHWVRSLDECTPEALFGPDWEDYVDQ